MTRTLCESLEDLTTRLEYLIQLHDQSRIQVRIADSPYAAYFSTLEDISFVGIGPTRRIRG